MNNDVLEFLKNNEVGVLAIQMADKTPHAATMHLSFTAEPFAMYFLTSDDTKKGETLFQQDKTPASVVIGTHAETEQSFQADGTLEKIPESEFEAALAEHLEKVPSHKDFAFDGHHSLFRFTPTWWRFTDWNFDPKKVISSE
jgi:nitroimidazol reductase NimA-like FMN-containing flavoprotein (pyridoxamine 5'-phosphate oxidase superfamily)